jgi:predicted AAA+ superfamily ATPase
LGSASRDLIKQSAESLAGRIGYIQLTPFTSAELTASGDFELNKFWFRGGFPLSYLATSAQTSNIWREQFIQTFLERDLPQLGFALPAMQMRRFLTMCAHVHGQVLNLSKLAGALGVTHPTIKKYIDLMEQTFMLRTLPPYELNIKKRLVKAPKIYLRDSGILHSLLAIEDFNALLGNPAFGASWEGMAIENILVNVPDWKAYFFRTATGDEADLVLEKGTKRVVVECKASVAPKLTAGFYRAVDFIEPIHVFVVAPIAGSAYPMAKNISVCNLTDIIAELKKL